MLQVLGHKLSTTLTYGDTMTVVDELTQVRAELKQLDEKEQNLREQLSSVCVAINTQVQDRGSHIN